MSFSILVVDDAPGIPELISNQLQMIFPDCQVSAHNNVPSAIQALNEKKIDIVISDWNMDEGGGEAVIEAALASSVPGDRIIVITGSGLTSEEAKENYEEALKHSIKGCLLKPFDIAKLQEVLT